MKADIINKIVLGMLLVIIIIVLLFIGVYIFYGNNPVNYNGIMKAEVVGNTVDVEVAYCRNYNIPFTSYVSFVDGIVFDLVPEKVGGASVGCGVVHRIWNIPDTLPDGTYHLDVRNEFEVTTFKTVTKGYRTTDFIINRNINK
jgi:hypothetical protein